MVKSILIDEAANQALTSILSEKKSDKSTKTGLLIGAVNIDHLWFCFFTSFYKSIHVIINIKDRSFKRLHNPCNTNTIK